MTELKVLDIAHRFCNCVLQECTGNRAEFAKYLGITPCRVTIYKRKIETLYKVKIHHSRSRHTYYVKADDRHKLPPPLFRIAVNYIKMQRVVRRFRTGLSLVVQNQRRPKSFVGLPSPTFKVR